MSGTQAPSSVDTLPPSTLYRSPVIIVNLVRPGYIHQASKSTNEAKSDSGSSGPSLKRKRSTEDTESAPTQTPAEANKGIIATFQLHTSALVAHSDYFKGLFSFNGLEMSEKEVNIESPLPDKYQYAIKVAFACFVDFIYTQEFDLLRYEFTNTENKKLKIGEWKEAEQIYLSAIYVFADRVLSGSLKLYSLRKFYSTTFSIWKRATNLSRGGAINWWNISRGAEVIEEGTVPKPGPNPSADKTSATEEDCQLPYLQVANRTQWAGTENIRKIFAAFLASIWLVRDYPKKSRVDEEFKGRRMVVAGRPDLNELILSYLSTNITFPQLPMSEFGLEEKDRP